MNTPDILLTDLRTALRRVAKTPLFAAIVIATLGLGIGAATALFNVVHSVLLRPLPYKDSERLALVWARTPPQDDDNAASYPEYEDWKQGASGFSDMAIWRGQSINYTGSGEPARFTGAFVTSNFLEMIGARMQLGRSFAAGEAEPRTGKPVALLSHALWVSQFASDPAVVGRAMNFNGAPYTIIGVVDQDMDPGRAPYNGWFMGTEVWLPIAAFPNARGLERGQSEMLVVGKLAPGVTVAAAQQSVNLVAERLEKAYPDTQAGRRAHVVPLSEQLVGDTRPALLMSLAAAIGVLLICCVNVANLLLTQTAARGRELATRTALGASALRLVRQQVTEGLLYGVCGGTLGVLIAYAGRGALVAMLPFPTGVAASPGLDRAVLGFCLVVSVCAGLLVSVVPALRLSKRSLARAIQSGSRSVAEGTVPRRTREALVIGELALSVALLVGAGLLLRSAHALRNVSPGFRADHVLTLQFRLPAAKYAEPAQIARFFDAAVEKVAALPGVRGAALARAVPYDGNGAPARPYGVEGQAERPVNELETAETNIVSPGYFATMEIPVLKGREFSRSDTTATLPAVIVSQTLAERSWPGADPLGRRIAFSKDGPWLTVVGVVGDVKHGDLTAPRRAQAYTAHAQDAKIFTGMVVRTETPPLAMAAAVRDAVWSIDRDQPMWRFRSMDWNLEEARRPAAAVATLAAVSAATAMLLSVLGLYGVLSYLVAQRTREIGVRMALGASRPNVLQLVLRRALLLAALGIALGVAGAFGWGRLLASLLFGVSAADPVTFAVVAALLLAIALVASYIPARRAASVDPAHALRWE